MKKVLTGILICCFQININAFAIGLELSDIIKQARDIEMKKNLAVKNTVKEIKEKSAQEEQSLEETIKPETIIQKEIQNK